MVTCSRIIDLKNISFGFKPDTPVLRNVSLSIGQGDKVSLEGPNGSGKTTLFHIIMGLLKPWGGEVEVFGELRKKERDFLEVRRRVGLLFQDSDDQLFSPTVAEDIAFGPFNLGKKRREVEAIVERTLALVGLEGFGDRITYQLSGGEKRLAALGTVLAMDPEVLLLDEPVIGLDEEHRERFESILRESSCTCLIISHNPGFLERVTRTRCLMTDLQQQ